MSEEKGFFAELSERHERLKTRIHAFRIPLSPTGQRIMGFVYFSIPVIAGYYIMKAAIGQADKNMKAIEQHKDSQKNEIGQQNAMLQQVLDSAKKKSTSNKP